MMKKKSTGGALINFFYPTLWKIFILIFLYFSNYISFIGTIINYPIFYFYWNYNATGFFGLVLFIAHILYVYTLACIVMKFIK